MHPDSGASDKPGERVCSRSKVAHGPYERMGGVIDDAGRQDPSQQCYVSVVSAAGGPAAGRGATPTRAAARTPSPALTEEMGSPRYPRRLGRPRTGREGNPRQQRRTAHPCGHEFEFYMFKYVDLQNHSREVKYTV